MFSPVRHTALALVALALSASGAAAASGDTLKTVKERGELICGVSQGLLGFSSVDDKGAWSGIDVDFCRAVAAAALPDPTKVRFVPLSASERFEALRDGKVDLLSRNSTWTFSRETDYGIVFTGVTYYDGQGFMLPKSLAISSALELDGAKVCTQAGTTSRENAIDFFAQNGMKLETVEVTSPDEALTAYQAGRCTVISSDISQLHASRLKLPKPTDHVILADVISKEPLAPAVRDGDPQWFSIVKWVGYALLNAEELGVSTQTLAEAKKSTKPEVKRLLVSEGSPKRLGLSEGWVSNVLSAVGNYGEIYERNVGAKSRLGIPRGLNQLWSQGGIQYAPPMR
jgi:general L-amino acid transport system substrate-binding protein